ncbi:unnamed protein product [Schistosoma turkestanicum]|nr:unnamed protein product [Schistosoma turkestanicum]
MRARIYFHSLRRPSPGSPEVLGFNLSNSPIKTTPLLIYLFFSAPPPYYPPTAPYPTQAPYSYPSYPQTNQPPNIGFIGSGYQPANAPTYGAPPTTVVVNQPTVIAIAYHRSPVGITCPYCHNFGMTRVQLESGYLPWLLCGIMCFFGLFFGCCLIPFCMDSIKSARHFCPSCHRQVGYYSPM